MQIFDELHRWPVEMSWVELCLAASALSNVFVLISWRHRFRGTINGNAVKLRVHSVDFSVQPAPSIVVTDSEMRRPDESKLAFLRLRSPKEKGNDFDRLKSPTGVYTGEPVPLQNSPAHSRQAVILLITSAFLICLFISGFLNELAPAVFPAAPQLWPSDLFSSNKENGIVPEFPKIQKMFRNHAVYQDTGVQGDDAWRDDLPKGHGVVELRWPEHLKLPKQAHYLEQSVSESQGIELAEVSVVKELDCLIKVRSALIGYEFNMRLSPVMKTEVHACLDYGNVLGMERSGSNANARTVRQAILCASDTTMEAAWDPGSSAPGSSGEEVFETERSAHTCRDWSKIRNWLEKHRKQ